MAEVQTEKPHEWPPSPPQVYLEDDSDEEPPPVIRDPNLVSPLDMMHTGRKVRQEKRMAASAQSQTGAVSTPLTGQDIDFTFDEHKGRPAPLGVKFAPFGAVSKYCYKFVPPQWLQPLASNFFDSDQIYNRNWEIYYTSPSDYSNALPFITEHKLQALINEINDEFPKANISIHEDIIIDFEDLPSHLRPRWAGHCSSRYQYNSLVNQIALEPDMVLPDSPSKTLAAFKAKMEAAADASKAKSKKAKAFKKQETMVKRQGMVKETLRAQRYLGLLPKNDDLLLPDISNLSMDSVDASKPTPHPFDNEPIFIAIDAEAYEKPPRVVTEVGVATLDTRDLKGHAPGEIGKDWHQHIRARHFRVIEYKDYVNREYIQGCPDGFEFGESELVGKSSIASVMSSCFREPFSKKTTAGTGIDSAAESAGEEPEKRNIVLVGHDLGQDVNYCHEIGFSVLNRGNILDSIDTVNLYRTFSKDPSARSLGSIIYDFDMSAWHLHNAGNDAVYTLHAMLAICIKTATERGNEEAAKKQEENIQKRTQVRLEDAMERAKEDAEGWDSPSGDDGGVPLQPTEKAFMPKSKAGATSNRPPKPSSGLYTVGGAILDV